MRNFFYLSPSRDGWQNLAMDEWFLDHLGPEDLMLYCYINDNAVIIGKNQNPWRECDLQAMDRDGVQLVRRVTGGGAVFHDAGNLNFSFIAGEGRYDVQRQLRVILRWMKPSGIRVPETTCWPTDGSSPAMPSAPGAPCGSTTAPCC